ncbi:MAG: hypothetical protein HKP12_11490 [Gammaproteobacteria bacterium]|nr:hypothetical protein [Gammaproteobacteria bacterium]
MPGRGWPRVSVAILLGTGTWMVYGIYGGFDSIPPHIMLMGLVALLMVVNYTYIFFVPYRQYQRLLQMNDMEACLHRLARIRFAGIINMVLGPCIVVIIGSGPQLL